MPNEQAMIPQKQEEDLAHAAFSFKNLEDANRL